jgi:rRNA maturation endonuclease Nob1
MEQRICDMCGEKILSGMYYSWQLIEDANPMSFTKNKHITDLCERCGKEIKNTIKKKKVGFK